MTQPRNTDLRNFPLGFFYIDSAEVFSDVRRRNKQLKKILVIGSYILYNNV